MTFIELPLDRKYGYCALKNNNPIIGARLGTPVRNTTALISGTSPELHQYNNPNHTSDLTYHPEHYYYYIGCMPPPLLLGSLSKIFP